jgi:hypothetical protein
MEILIGWLGLWSGFFQHAADACFQFDGHGGIELVRISVHLDCVEKGAKSKYTKERIHRSDVTSSFGVAVDVHFADFRDPRMPVRGRLPSMSVNSVGWFSV